jgi:hypothetical protein
LSTSINAMAPAFCREIARATIGLPGLSREAEFARIPSARAGEPASLKR